jgi:hypothetical protein
MLRGTGLHPSSDRTTEGTREEHGDNVLVRMRPERWLTADFAKSVESP